MTFGGKRGTASIVVYIALGACGVPVFSGFGAGLASLLGPTGGFLFGFVAMGMLYTFCEKRFGKSDKVIISSLAAGTLLCYVLGTAVFMIWSGANGTPVAIFGALSTCVFPCIVPDALKIYLAHRIYKTSLSKLKV
jgi:biotin transport system substrate-specific component